MALSDSWLRANYNKPREKVTEKADRDGLSARVSATGKIKWQIRYSYNGKMQRCDLGSYPLMGLADARDEARRYRGELAEGRDPRAVKAFERAEALGADTFQVLFLQWWKSNKSDTKSGWEIKATFELHVLPEFGKYLIGEITLHAWLEFLEDQAKARPMIAVRILTNAKLFYRWAVKRKMVPFNPLAEVSPLEDLKVKQGVTTRILSRDELYHVYIAIDKSKVWSKNKLLLELCLFFGCRVSELRLATRKDFDLKNKLWTVPWENHKTGSEMKKPIKRPIIDEIVPTLEKLFRLSRGKYLFPHRHEDRPVSDRSHIKIPGALIEWLKEHRNISMPHWSVHDLRRTARSNWSAFTTNRDVPEIMLGHTLGGVRSIYDQHDYLEEQAAVYRAWWDLLQRIRYPELYQNVVTLKTNKGA